MNPIIFILFSLLCAYKISNNTITVSGLSGGAFFAVQFQISFSGLIKGAAIVAGGPYWCAEGNIEHCVAACNLDPGKINLDKIFSKIESYEKSKLIDPISNLKNQTFYVYSGKLDTTIPQGVVKKLVEMYSRISVGKLVEKFDISSEHAFITNYNGHPCWYLGSPFINNCKYDQALEILSLFYGIEKDKVTPKDENVVKFDQSKYESAGFDDVGYLYVPTACKSNTGTTPCRLHISFHGCTQGKQYVGFDFIKNAGFNRWAESNEVIVMYPQIKSHVSHGDPLGCFDYWGYTGDLYATKSGKQTKAVREMIQELFEI